MGGDTLTEEIYLYQFVFTTENDVHNIALVSAPDQERALEALSNQLTYHIQMIQISQVPNYIAEALQKGVLN